MEQRLRGLQQWSRGGWWGGRGHDIWREWSRRHGGGDDGSERPSHSALCVQRPRSCVRAGLAQGELLQNALSGPCLCFAWLGVYAFESSRSVCQPVQDLKPGNTCAVVILSVEVQSRSQAALLIAQPQKHTHICTPDVAVCLPGNTSAEQQITTWHAQNHEPHSDLAHVVVHNIQPSSHALYYLYCRPHAKTYIYDADTIIRNCVYAHAYCIYSVKASFESVAFLVAQQNSNTCYQWILFTGGGYKVNTFNFLPCNPITLRCHPSIRPSSWSPKAIKLIIPWSQSTNFPVNFLICLTFFKYLPPPPFCASS